MAVWLGLTGPARAEGEHLQLVGFQLRLIWPATGAVSPDVFAAQAADPQVSIYCGHITFANGESWEQLGAPFRAILLIGVALPVIDGVYGDNGYVRLSQRVGQGDALYDGPRFVHVSSSPGQTTWHPVAIVSDTAPVERLVADMNGQRISPPDLRTGCGE